MKHLSRLPVLTGLCTGLGILCLCIRQWLLQTGVDSKGLLTPGHPGTWISLLLLAAVTVILCLALRQRQPYQFHPSTLSAVSMLFFAVGYGFAAWKLISDRAQTLSLIAGILALVSVLCSLLLSVALLRKFRLHPFVYCPPVLFLMVLLICRYQQWSGESELQRYLFQLLSVLSLMFAAYHRAALESDKKGIRPYLLLSRAAIFFCISAIPGGSYAVLYGCCAVALVLDGFAEANRQEA